MLETALKIYPRWWCDSTTWYSAGLEQQIGNVNFVLLETKRLREYRKSYRKVSSIQKKTQFTGHYTLKLCPFTLYIVPYKLISLPKVSFNIYTYFVCKSRVFLHYLASKIWPTLMICMHANHQRLFEISCPRF